MASRVKEHFAFASNALTRETIINSLNVGSMIQDFKFDVSKPDIPKAVMGFLGGRKFIDSSMHIC
jgi:hypothetical protein